MITELRAQNFKSWQDTGVLRFAPLTGLFGANSSGKTSILQVLLMLMQTVDSPDRNRVLHFGDDRPLVDFGTFHDLLYTHKTDLTLQLNVSWKLSKPLFVSRTPLFPINNLTFHTEIHEENDRPLVARFHYTTDSDEFGMPRSINVVVVANGRSEQASSDCVEICGERLEEIMRGEVKLVLDNRWIILGEYMQNLRSNGADILVF